MTPDCPVPLNEACRELLGGRWTKKTLFAEAARGNLTIFLVGRTMCVTPSGIAEMVRLCQENRRVHVSTWTRPAESGSSGMARYTSALDALKASTDGLKRSSRTTLPTNTNRRADQIR